MLRYAMISEPGNRDGNEDYVGEKILDSGEEGCFVLCDGLGGHGQGEVASRFIVEEVLQIFKDRHSDLTFLNDAFEESQAHLMCLQEEKHAKNELKTTAVLLHIMKDKIHWGHIGDSRLYYFEKGKIKQRTMDHSVPQMLVAAGEIKEKEIRHHPDRNRLLRVMGMEWDSPKYTLASSMEKNNKQAFLLCSDGFWELIEEKKMERCLKKAKSPEAWLDSMKEIVVKNGKGIEMDNFSAIAVFVEGKENGINQM